MDKNGVAWTIFVACILLGIGIGKLFDQQSAGTLIGVGVGFLAMAVVKWKK